MGCLFQVNPQVVVGRRRRKFHALFGGVTRDEGGDLLDVDESGDGIGEAFVPRHIAVGAARSAARRRARRDEVAGAVVGFHFERLARAQNQHVSLDLKPVARVALVAVKTRDVPVRSDFDARRVGKLGENFERAREFFDAAFVINGADIEKGFGRLEGHMDAVTGCFSFR